MALPTERQLLVTRYRRRGMAVADIATTLGVTEKTIRGTLTSAYRNIITNDEMIEARNTELSRLDELHSSFYEDALKGDIKAAEVVLKTSDRRAKLLGLDAPQRTESSSEISIGWLDESISPDNVVEMKVVGENEEE